MKILENVDLSQYSTMRLGGRARYLTDVISRADIEESVSWAQSHSLPIIMIGGGSNIFWRDDGFDGLVLVNKIMGYDDRAEDDLNHYVTVGAGENWDEVVARTVNSGLSGIEALSLIPGTTGATPIQNVGAYGQDISQTLVSLEAFDTVDGRFVTFPASECGLGYRTSRFKTTDRQRYLIISITLHLHNALPVPPFYRAVEDYLRTHAITDITAPTIRSAVIAIRSSKLPDPALIANNGSFFANPVIDPKQAKKLQTQFTDMPVWPDDNGAKIPAAWLIEQTGFKDYHDAATGMATWHSQPLVLVNETATSYADLEAFKQKIVDAVQDTFGITLQQEPELLPYQ